MGDLGQVLSLKTWPPRQPLLADEQKEELPKTMCLPSTAPKNISSPTSSDWCLLPRNSFSFDSKTAPTPVPEGASTLTEWMLQKHSTALLAKGWSLPERLWLRPHRYYKKASETTTFQWWSTWIPKSLGSIPGISQQSNKNWVSAWRITWEHIILPFQSFLPFPSLFYPVSGVFRSLICPPSPPLSPTDYSVFSLTF